MIGSIRPLAFPNKRQQTFQVTQHKAIATLKSLLPEINETKDPEGVLIKYAHAENLSAAQLEHMAHVFNTLKTINVMDKAASRGASFEILDPEAMIDKFQAAKPARKVATIRRGGEIYLEKVAGTAVARAVSEGPSWGDFAPDMTPAHQSGKSASVMSAHVGKSETRVAYEQAADVIRQERDQAFAEFTKKAGADLTPALQDMRALAPDEFATVEQHLKQAGIGRDIPADGRVAVWDRAGVRDVFCKYASAVRTLEAVVEMLGEFEKQAFSPTDVMEAVRKAEQTKNPDDESEARRRKFDYQTRTGRDPEVDWKEEDAKAQEHVAANPYVNVRPGEHGYAEAHSRALANMDAEAVRNYLNGPAAAPAKGKPEKGGTLEALYGGLAGLLQGAGDTLRSGASLDTAKATASNYVELANPASRDRMGKLQQAQSSTRAVANLQRLMMTDPIISQADPDKVVQSYNSLRAAYPELVNDVNVARSLLRESLQYPHLPLNTLQSLISMRETALKTRTPGKPAAVPSPSPSSK